MSSVGIRRVKTEKVLITYERSDSKEAEVVDRMRR